MGEPRAELAIRVTPRSSREGIDGEREGRVLVRVNAPPVDGKANAAVARVLGTCRAVLMRNHGVLVAGKDVPWAVLTAATLERAAEIQALAGTLGGALTPMSIEDARRLAPAKYRDAFAREYWDAWLRQVGG